MLYHVMDQREKLSKIWHENLPILREQANFSFKSLDHYYAFCAAKDWIQDTPESLNAHWEEGFSKDPYRAYIEVYGVFQAIYVLQDAIREMDYALFDVNPKSKSFSQPKGWMELRELRNQIVGHPTRQGKEIVRTVIDRSPKSYSQFNVVQYVEGKHRVLTFNLSKLIECFDAEAADIIKKFCVELRNRL